METSVPRGSPGETLHYRLLLLPTGGRGGGLSRRRAFFLRRWRLRPRLNVNAKETHSARHGRPRCRLEGSLLRRRWKGLDGESRLLFGHDRRASIVLPHVAAELYSGGEHCSADPAQVHLLRLGVTAAWSGGELPGLVAGHVATEALVHREPHAALFACVPVRILATCNCKRLCNGVRVDGWELNSLLLCIRRRRLVDGCSMHLCRRRRWRRTRSIC